MESSDKVKPIKEVCCECGKAVILGSGLFVNRVMVFDDHKTKIERGCPYPEGEFICPNCESESGRFA
jgi:hypothetical protein